MTAHITLNAIRKYSPCESGWVNLLAYLGKTKADNQPLSLLAVLESNGVEDALWCLRALPDQYEGRVRLLVCDIAERALRLVPEGEDRPRRAIETARRYARGAATMRELQVAREAAHAAAVPAADAAAWGAANATAKGAARDAALSAWRAARDAAVAAWTAAVAAGDDAGDAALVAERETQASIFRQHVEAWEAGE